MKIIYEKEIKTMGIFSFFKNAFSSMKKSVKAQHEVDKANFEAVKAERFWEDIDKEVHHRGAN
jgi:hypothetical protein